MTATTPTTGAARLRALSDLLWHERDLLETLRYRLEVEQLVLDAGRMERLPIASKDVEETLRRIRAAELGRAGEVVAVARALGLPEDASLAELADAAPPPWDGMLTEHRTALLTLTSDIRTTAASNRESLATAHRATQETLLSLHSGLETYDERGTTSRRHTGAQLLDESL